MTHNEDNEKGIRSITKIDKGNIQGEIGFLDNPDLPFNLSILDITISRGGYTLQIQSIDAEEKDVD